MKWGVSREKTQNPSLNGHGDLLSESAPVRGFFPLPHGTGLVYVVLWSRDREGRLGFYDAADDWWHCSIALVGNMLSPRCLQKGLTTLTSVFDRASAQENGDLERELSVWRI